jgi:hypothetical protein
MGERFPPHRFDVTAFRRRRSEVRRRNLTDAQRTKITRNVVDTFKPAPCLTVRTETPMHKPARFVSADLTALIGG